MIRSRVTPMPRSVSGHSDCSTVASLRPTTPRWRSGIGPVFPSAEPRSGIEVDPGFGLDPDAEDPANRAQTDRVDEK